MWGEGAQIFHAPSKHTRSQHRPAPLAVLWRLHSTGSLSSHWPLVIELHLQPFAPPPSPDCGAFQKSLTGGKTRYHSQHLENSKGSGSCESETETETKYILLIINRNETRWSFVVVFCLMIAFFSIPVLCKGTECELPV